MPTLVIDPNKLTEGDVRSYTDLIETDLDQCDNGEGVFCSTLDRMLSHYASVCDTYCESVRKWAGEVFAGRVVRDPKTEGIWKSKGERLALRAEQMMFYGKKYKGPCYHLDGLQSLEAASLGLIQMLSRWVSPQVSVSPGPRHGFGSDLAEIAKIRQRLAALKPFPADWEPADPGQKKLYARLKSSE